MRSGTIPVKLNLAVAQANLNHDSELILAIGKVVIDDLPLLVVNLQTALERKDPELLKLMAHTIKGLASNFQAEPLMRLAEQLETGHPRLSELETENLVSEIALVSEATIHALTEILGLDS